MIKPRVLRPGDRVAIVAPGSPFVREDFDAGIAELRGLGFDPVFAESVFATHESGYLAGSAEDRARAFLAAWDDPSIAALIAARGGYGSVHLLPLLDADRMRRTPKAFIGYSDNTSLLTWLTQAGIVAFHGPMIEGRFGKGASAYDRDTFERSLCRTDPVGEIVHDGIEVLSHGEAIGELTGGTLTQLAASLGTPYAFDPPAGSILFIDEVGERPYRLDRLLTQLRFAGILGRAAGIVFNELPRCDEPSGSPAAKATVARVLQDFRGPVLFGLPSGHTPGATMTLPFGVRARIRTARTPALIIEESAVRP